jgi:hypothetical protein
VPQEAEAAQQLYVQLRREHEALVAAQAAMVSGVLA